MATNSAGEGKQLVSVGLPLSLAAEIDRRAGLLKWSRNRYVVALVQRWYDEGARPVDELEDLALEPRPVTPADPLSRRTYVGAVPRQVSAEYVQREPREQLAAEDVPPPVSPKKKPVPPMGGKSRSITSLPLGGSQKNAG